MKTRRAHGRLRREGGYVLLFALVLGALLAVAVAAIYKGLRQRQAIVDRTVTQDLAINLGGEATTTARLTLRTQLTTEQIPSITIAIGQNIAQMPLVRTDDQQLPLPLPSVAWGAANIALSTLGSGSSESDDPFGTLPAVVIPTSAGGVIDMYGVQLADSASASPMQVRAVIDFRTIPVSAWTLFASEGALSVGKPGAPITNVGRIYARGDLNVNGSVRTAQPLVVSGNVVVAASEAGQNSFQVATADGRSATVADGQSTGSNDWVVQQATAGGARAITTGKDRPVALATVGSANTVFTPTIESDKRPLRYPSAASFSLREESGGFRPIEEGGNQTSAVSIKPTPRYVAGPVIRVDAPMLAQARGGEPVSIYLTSTNPAAIVLVTGTNTTPATPLAARFSVASDLPIYVEGDFLTAGASFVTPSGVRRVIEDF